MSAVIFNLPALGRGVLLAIIAGPAAILAALATIHPTGDQGNSPPQLWVANTVHDFGHILSRSEPIALICVRNDGAHRLIISEETSSCSCSREDRQHSWTIPPHRSIDIPVRWVSQQTPGRHEQHRQFYSNDPLRPSLMLSLVADVE